MPPASLGTRSTACGRQLLSLGNAPGGEGVRPPTRVPAPCTDSMPQQRRHQGPSVYPPGRRATVACVLLPD
eukprot:1236432-Prymnesium_polylepis.1